MGYGGKIEEQHRARVLRAQAWALADIATELGVAKSSVSRWVRDVDFEPMPRRRARKRGPNKLQRAKAAETERCRTEGLSRVGELTDREFLMAGLGLYAGDGAKSGTSVHFANSNPDIVAFFCRWFRTFFDVDESRLRITLYLHAGLDLDAAEDHWAAVTGIPTTQFNKPYRAVPDDTRRSNRHVRGCCHVRYHSVSDLRMLLGLMNGLILVGSSASVRGSSAGRAFDC